MWKLVLASPLTKYLTAALTAVILFVGVYIKGRDDGTAIAEAAIAQERADMAEAVRKREAAIADLQKKHEVDVATVHEQYKAKVTTLTAEINKLRKKREVVDVFVPPRVDFKVNYGFVALHNTAAEGRPLPSTIPNGDKPSDIPLSDVGLVVAENYYQCQMTRTQLEALQKVVRDFQAKQKEAKK